MGPKCHVGVGARPVRSSLWSPSDSSFVSMSVVLPDLVRAETQTQGIFNIKLLDAIVRWQWALSKHLQVQEGHVPVS